MESDTLAMGLSRSVRGIFLAIPVFASTRWLPSLREGGVTSYKVTLAFSRFESQTFSTLCGASVTQCSRRWLHVHVLNRGSATTLLQKQAVAN